MTAYWCCWSHYRYRYVRVKQLLLAVPTTVQLTNTIIDTVRWYSVTLLAMRTETTKAKRAVFMQYRPTDTSTGVDRRRDRQTDRQTDKSAHFSWITYVLYLLKISKSVKPRLIAQHMNEQYILTSPLLPVRFIYIYIQIYINIYTRWMWLTNILSHSTVYYCSISITTMHYKLY